MDETLRPATSAEEGDPAVEKSGRPGPIGRGHAGGGGLTGETGALVPEETGNEEFVPGELREASHSRLAGTITGTAHGSADRHRRQVGEQRESPSGPTNLAHREGGYGGHGLAEDDPAYRYEVEPEERAPRPAPSPPRETTGGTPRTAPAEPGPRHEGDSSGGASDRL